MSVYIIAEAGVNHNGDFNTALKLVDAAVDAGVNAIKFQTFKAEKLASKKLEKADYQKKETEAAESQRDMLKKLELSFADFSELQRYCQSKNIEFLSTAFDFESLDFLKSLDMKRWKIPSGEITNLPYLIEIAKTGKEIILSTGMADMDEIEAAIKALKENGAGEIIVLHCTTEYPAPFAEVNLKAIESIKERFNVRVGYSDHTKGIEVPIAAVALGAEVIEKHFTLDNNMEGPDHKASLEPAELKAMTAAIRNIELALGDGIKKVSPSEQKNRAIVRKTIVASKKIKAGESFSADNLTTKRAGEGLCPMQWFDVLGQKAKRDFDVDEIIEI